MAILLTGGTGKTAVRIARFLQDAKVPFLLASRRGEAAAPAGMPATKFDWLDSSTFLNPFQYNFPGEESISAIYLVAPGVTDPAISMNDFIDYAIKEHGVRRFVLLCGSTTEPDDTHLGKVWHHLLEREIDYCVLRPTWFMNNFSEGLHTITIKSESKIYTACNDGKIPFISAADIAAVAFRALTDEKSHNTDHLILGPKLLTHDEIASKLSTCLERQIEHVKLTEEQSAQTLIGRGLPEYHAKYLATLEVLTATGTEARTNDVVQKVTGQPAQTFDQFARENKAVWQ